MMPLINKPLTMVTIGALCLLLILGTTPSSSVFATSFDNDNIINDYNDNNNNLPWFDFYAANLLVTSDTCSLLRVETSPPSDHVLSKLSDPASTSSVMNGVQITSRPAVVEENRPEDNTDELSIDMVGVDPEHVRDAILSICNGKTIIDLVSSNPLPGTTSDIAAKSRTPFVPTSALPGDEVIKLVHTGDPKNRIDVVFMGDGYTAKERGKFIDDMTRITNDMFSSDTFASYLPLFNIWAVFRPSKESGIGTQGRAKDTPFGLFREGTELRAIYCSKRFAAVQACKLTGEYACDYPSLIANDDFYGGLGGQFVIATSSNTSGTIVLRQYVLYFLLFFSYYESLLTPYSLLILTSEMGHNFIQVGEEYDGGYVYSGVNSARGLNSVDWLSWASDEYRKSDGKVTMREERATLRVQAYPWHDLGKGAWKTSFTSDGTFHRWSMLISASGVPEPDSLEIFLDGEKLPWKSVGHNDRSFYDFGSNSTGLSRGDHTLEFRTVSKRQPNSDVIPQICSVTVHEYGNEQEYRMNNTIISAYPTWSIQNRKTYRPTSSKCLMREMRSKEFCSVCKEGMWTSFFEKISVIDGVEVSCRNGKRKNGLEVGGSKRRRLGANTFTAESGDNEDEVMVDFDAARDDSGAVKFSLQLLPLAHLRRPSSLDGKLPVLPDEEYKITWFKVLPNFRGNEELTSFANSTTMEVSMKDAKANQYKVKVVFKTSEMRKFKDGYVFEKNVKFTGC